MAESMISASYKQVDELYGKRYLRLKVIIHIATRNLMKHKLRTILTAGGVMVGIGSITFLLSLGLGLQSLVTDQVLKSKSVTAIDVTPPGSNIVELDAGSVSKIAQIMGVKEIAKDYTLASKVVLENSATDAVVYAVDDEYLELSSLRLVTSGSLSLGQNEVLVNTSLLRVVGLTDPAQAVGKALQLEASVPQKDGTKTQVALAVVIKGVIDTGSGAEIFMSIASLERQTPLIYSQLKVVTDKQEQVPVVRRQIEELGYTTASPIDTLTQINQLFGFFNFILVGFGGIGMLVAVMGMFNTLTISLLERTRETALMVSLGARRKDIYRLFVTEAIGLAILGGVAGVAASWLVGVIINQVLGFIARERGVDAIRIFSMPWWLILMAMVFVILVAIVVVAYPARRSVRVNPVDALRRE